MPNNSFTLKNGIQLIVALFILLLFYFLLFLVVNVYRDWVIQFNWALVIVFSLVFLIIMNTLISKAIKLAIKIIDNINRLFCILGILINLFVFAYLIIILRISAPTEYKYFVYFAIFVACSITLRAFFGSIIFLIGLRENKTVLYWFSQISLIILLVLIILITLPILWSTLKGADYDLWYNVLINSLILVGFSNIFMNALNRQRLKQIIENNYKDFLD